MSTAEQQRRWRASQGARSGTTGRRPTEPCGTVAAYKRHLRQRQREREQGLPLTEIDQACKDANAAATNARRKARSEK